MKNETMRGRAQLRDTGPAQGLYDADYTVHVNTRIVKDIGKPARTRKTVSVDIRLVNGYTLKNGPYSLEKDGTVLYQLEKTGAIWRIVSDAVDNG